MGIALTLSAFHLTGRFDTLDPRKYLPAFGNTLKQTAPSDNKADAKEARSKKNFAASRPPSPDSALATSGARHLTGPEPQDGRNASSPRPENPLTASLSSEQAGSASLPISNAESRTEGSTSVMPININDLPYEESLNASLDERIRQVDYAIMQASWLKKIPASALRLVSVEDRLEGIEPYQYQIIDILPGKNAKEYAQALKNSLTAWAEGATLQNQGDTHWLIYINGVQTHHIRLFPGKEEFPPLPGCQDKGASPPAQSSLFREDSGLLAPEPSTPPSGNASLSPAPPGDRRPFCRASGEAARMVIVMDDLGANHLAVQQLLALDYPVTFAFWPHGSHTMQGSLEAHRAGREIIIHQPMEPLGYPRVNPGPNALLVGMPPEKIHAILEDSIAAVPHAVGLNNHMGSRFTQNTAGINAVVSALQRHGLFSLDSLTHNNSVFASEARRLGLKTYQRSIFLDVTPVHPDIIKALRQAERIALLTGHSIAIGHPLPETLSALKAWQSLRNTEILLVKLQDLQQ